MNAHINHKRSYYIKTICFSQDTKKSKIINFNKGETREKVREGYAPRPPVDAQNI